VRKNNGLDWIARVILVAIGVTIFTPVSSARAETSTPTSTLSSPWKPTAAFGVKESYDSNVFLDESGPLGGRDSFVTTFLPQLGVAFSPGAKFKGTFLYAPEVSLYHSEHGEDFTAHKWASILSGVTRLAEWDFSNNLTWIDGAHRNLVFGKSGPPAAGGIPIRDRRDAIVYRNSIQTTFPIGKWFVRPVSATYIHDFRSVQSTEKGYQNYANRKDVSGGIDVGRKLTDGLSAFVGFRYGWQDQEQLFGTGAEFSNNYRRVLVGVQGTPWSWMKVSLVAGPDFRHFGENAPEARGGSTVPYVDASVSVTPDKQDVFTLTAKSFEQPGFGGRSIYQDSTFEVGWKRSLPARFAVGLGFRAYNTDFRPSAKRNDWIYTVTGLVAYNVTKQINIELSYNFDDAETEIPDTEGREFRRNLVALGVRWVN
jgi:hypothetical protein